MQRIFADKKSLSLTVENELDDEHHDDGDWISINTFEGQYCSRFLIREFTHTEGNLLHMFLNQHCENARVVPEKESVHRTRCFIVEIDSYKNSEETPLQLLKRSFQHFENVFSNFPLPSSFQVTNVKKLIFRK